MKTRKTRLPFHKAAIRDRCDSLDALYELACRYPTDMQEHVPRLRKLVKGKDTVVEFGVREGISTIGLLMGKPKLLISVDINVPPLHDLLKRVSGICWKFVHNSSMNFSCPVCDVLMIDTVHTAEHLNLELQKHASAATHRIVLHDTSTHPTLWESAGKLLATGQWVVESHNPGCHGLTVLSRDRNRPKDIDKANR